jgi:hypothetical protein
MGFVWNIMLSFDNEELWPDGADQPTESCEPLDRINAWIPDGRLVSLVGPTYRDNAGNGLDANLYGGGFKHFDIEKFIKVVEAQKWKERKKVQLWVRGAEEGMSEDVFTLVKLRPRPLISFRSRSSRRKRRRGVRKKQRSA